MPTAATTRPPNVLSGTVTVAAAPATATETITSFGTSTAVITEGGAAQVSGTFADGPAGLTHTVTLDWGDGTAAVQATVDDAHGTFSASHAYADTPAGIATGGAFTVTATLATPSETAVSTARTSVVVNDAAPVLASLSFSSV